MSKESLWIEEKKEYLECFTNPYNFVPLQDSCSKENIDIEMFYSNLQDDLLTGWLDISIEPKTLTFIPNTSNTNANAFNKRGKQVGADLKSYDFFTYNDLSNESDRTGKYSMPVIPGSEIRGVIRSAFEVITNSCMSSVDIKQALYKRTMLTKEPGILRKDEKGWYIEKAKREVIEKDHEDTQDLKEGAPVQFDLKSVWIKGKEKKFAKIVPNGEYTGIFHRTAKFHKKNDSIFIPTGEKVKYIDEEVINRFKKVVELYQDNKNEDCKIYMEYKVENGCLLYYNEDKKDSRQTAQYLSPACITKEVFKNTLEMILKEQGGYDPCRSSKEICPSCRLFGMVEENEQVASRVRFTDAVPKLKLENNKEYKQFYNEEIILAELASPKLSATEFYLERPSDEIDLWNYDYAVKGKQVIKIDNYQPKIRGRKFYWHHIPQLGKSYYKVDDVEKHTERNVMVRPIKPIAKNSSNNPKDDEDNKENLFIGKAYFNNVTSKELNELIWTLNIGNNDNDNCHKIGMGKPLGLGSIKIRVEKVNYRSIKVRESAIEYSIEAKDINEIQYHKDIDEKTLDEFLIITNFKNSPLNVSYPQAVDTTGSQDKENTNANHQWFTGNKFIDKNNPNKNRTIRNLGIYKELPRINKTHSKLPKLRKVFKKN